MRATQTNQSLKVLAIAGTYVVTLGLDLPEEDCKELLGFLIHKIDHSGNNERYLKGMKAFAKTDPGFPVGTVYPTDKHPIQSFQWADYAAEPGHEYTYTIAALKGEPKKLEPHTSVTVRITTESPEGGNQDVYLNRGVVASQEYVRRFGDRKPADVPNDQAFTWLSRGIYEAMFHFIEDAELGKHSLRIAAYEFRDKLFLRVLKAVINRGVDVKIVSCARKNQPRDKNRIAVRKVELKDNCIERQANKSSLSNNKFILRLKNGQPTSVWTGGTNFSEGDIFGHSNAEHVLEEPTVAAKYHS